jgi:hypothetical protein
MQYIMVVGVYGKVCSPHGTQEADKRNTGRDQMTDYSGQEDVFPKDMYPVTYFLWLSPTS